jgi:hypothetical protein
MGMPSVMPALLCVSAIYCVSIVLFHDVSMVFKWCYCVLCGVSAILLRVFAVFSQCFCSVIAYFCGGLRASTVKFTCRR